MGTKKAGPKAGSKPQGAQPLSEGLREVADAYLRLRKSPASLKTLKKLAAANPSALAEVCLAKAALLLGVQAATKADTLAAGDAALLAAAHEALEHFVTAAVEHRSLVALKHSQMLLDRALVGLPDWEVRQEQRRRLLQGRPPGELQAQGAAAFAQLGQDVLEQEPWPLDAGYTWKDGSLQGVEAFVQQVVGEYERMAAEAERVGQSASGLGSCYEEAMFELREKELQVAASLEDPEDDEPRIETASTAPLCMRLVYLKYLHKSDQELLHDWSQARRVEEHARRRMAWRRQQERQFDGEAGMALRARLREASAAELEARMRARKLGKFLKEQLSAECSSGGAPEERQGAADQERRVAALLRLASMPLPDFRRLLEEGPAGGRAVQGVAAAAGEGADVADAAASEVRRMAAVAAAADNDVAHALQLLLSGTVGAAQFRLPKPLERQSCQMHGRSSPDGGSPASGGSGDSGRQQFQRQLEQLVSDPEALAECKRQLLEEVAELRLVLGSADVAPEQSPPLPSDYVMPGLDLPPSAEAIMPAELLRDIYARDGDVFGGPRWRSGVLKLQRERGLSRPPAGAENTKRARPDLHSLATDDRASRFFGPALCDLMDFNSEDTGLSETAAAHYAALLLADCVGTDKWRCKMEMCLKRVLLGHGLIEAVLQQQEAQRAAPPTGRRSGRTVRFKGGLRGWASSSSSGDSDDEAAGGLAGTFVGGSSPGPAGSAGAAPSAAAAPPAAAAAQLAALHAAAASIHAASVAEMLSRVVPDGKLREGGMQVAMGAMAAASQSRGVALGSEAGHLLVHLLPLPDGLAVPTASDERVTVEIRVVEQLRLAVLRRILAALRHLASQGRLVRHPLLQAAVDYVNVGLDDPRLLSHVRPGSERWAPWNRLGVAPLGELMTMYGALATYFSREFAAGPAALGPPFQDALAHVLSGIELLPSAPVPAGASHKEQAEQAEEGAEAPAAAGSVPAVRLSQLGLACAVTAASAVQRTPAERGACTPAQLVRKSLNQATATPPNLPARMLPPADECAVSLAQCLERLPALAAMVRQLRETGDTESGQLEALGHLRRLQLWRNLTLHAYHSAEDFARQQQQTTVRQFMQLMHLMQKVADSDAEPGLSELLCGTDSEPGLLAELAQRCDNLIDPLVHQCYTVQLHKSVQDIWQWRCSVQQLTTLCREVRAQMKGLTEGSAAKRSLEHFLTQVTATARAAGANVLASCDDVIKEELSRQGRMRFLCAEVPQIRAEVARLMGCIHQLEQLARDVQRTDGSNAAVRGVLLEQRVKLQRFLLEAQSALQSRLSDVVETRTRMFYMADLVLRAEMSVFATHVCMHSPLEPLAQQLVERALPHKWAQLVEAQQAQQAAAGLLGLAFPPSGQPAGGNGELEAPAKGGKQLQQQQQKQDAQERQRQAKEEAKRQQEAAAAAAAAAALLEEEEQQAEKQAKERQRKEQAKRQAAQQRAAAAAAAAAAKRKAAEEEAAAAAAAAAAAKKAAEQEDKQQRQAQLEEERRREEQLIQQRLEEQTRLEAEMLNRQRREAEQQRQQQEAERQRQQREAEQRRQQQEAEQQRQRQAQEQRQQQQAQEQAQLEQQQQAKVAQQAQRQEGGQASAAAPAVGTPSVVEQLAARPLAVAPAADSAAPAAVPAQQRQLQPAPVPQQQRQPQPAPVPPLQPQAAVQQSQQAAAPAPSSRQTGNIDWEAEAAAAERLLSADGEFDISKLDGVLAGGTAAARGTAAAAGSRPGSGSSAARQAAPTARPGSAGGARPGSAGSDRPGSAGAAGQAERPPARFVSWTGAWMCECGQLNQSIKEHCRRCDARDPCLRWFKGSCDESVKKCRLPHLWFELPPEKPKHVPGGISLARPHPDYIYKRKPRPLAAKPAVPAASAWQQPSSAAAGSSWDAGAKQAQQEWQRQQPQPQAEQPQAAGGAAPASSNWAAIAKPPPALQSTAVQRADAAPQQEAQPAVEEPEDELAGLLDMMGIGEANGTDSAAPAPAAGGWGEPSSWAHQVGSSHELEGVDQAPGSWPAPGQDVEDAELAAAIQASLADAAATASRHQAGAWQELPAAAPARSSGAAAAGESSDSEALALAGLRNEAGEYNCFLNVVVQCLWRCAEFRQQVAGWDAAFCAHDPVLAALHGLFAQLEQQEAARSSAAAHGTSGSLPPVDPAPLREALAALPGQGFSLGEMNDAAELLLCVYEKVMEAEGAGGRGAELAATFGLAVREEVHCAACGKTTHQNAYTQYFYNTQATTLQMAQLVAEGAASMGALLRDAEAQHRKSCDTDMSGCGVLNSVNHFLQAAPRVFTLQVAWETHAPAPDVVASTLAALDETVDLGEVYQGVDRGLHRYALRSMVCYYGQHYQALVLVPEAGGWLMFDDTRVSRVGSWADVQRKCEAGRIQPSLLFYEAV